MVVVALDFALEGCELGGGREGRGGELSVSMEMLVQRRVEELIGGGGLDMIKEEVVAHSHVKIPR